MQSSAARFPSVGEVGVEGKKVMPLCHYNTVERYSTPLTFILNSRGGPKVSKATKYALLNHMQICLKVDNAQDI